MCVCVAAPELELINASALFINTDQPRRNTPDVRKNTEFTCKILLVDIQKNIATLNSTRLNKRCVYREAWEQNPAEPSVSECVRDGGISELHVTCHVDV